MFSTDSIIPRSPLSNKCSFYFCAIHLLPAEEGEFFIMLNTYEVNTENNGFTVSKIVKAPASTYLYLEVPEEYENVQMILTDADGNKLEKFGGTTTDPENGMYEIQLQFEQTDTNQIHV